MAHYRKPVAAAVALNTAIFVVEAIACDPQGQNESQIQSYKSHLIGM
jgi:hypothetical protein